MRIQLLYIFLIILIVEVMNGHAYKAAIIGGSGEVGNHALKALLNSSNCTHITSISRRKLDFPPEQQGLEKLKQIIIPDLANLETEAKDILQGHEIAIIAMGVGNARRVPIEDVKKVEINYTTTFAKLCKEGGTQHISLLSAPLVSKTSFISKWIPILQIKAQAHENLQSLNFTRTSFFCPSFILTPKVRYGWTDALYMPLFKAISPILPSSWRAVTSEALGKSMVLNAELTRKTGVEELYYGDFQRVLTLADLKK